MVEIRQLVWDEWNIGHIKKHKVSADEVEEAVDFEIKTFVSYKDRILVLGRTKKGRLLTVILAPEDKQSLMLRNKQRYYVVTARDMSRKEKRLLKNEKS